MTGIYKITSPSGKVYIGQSWNIKIRFTQYKLNNKCKSQHRVYNSFEKYGIENHTFEIVHELPIDDVEQEVLDRYEQFYMDLYRDAGIELMNLREAGSHGKHSEESKKKQSLAKIGKPNWRKGERGRKLLPISIIKREETKRIKGTTGKGKSKSLHQVQTRLKPIIQYDLNNNFIKEWTSGTEIQKVLKINKGLVSQCVLGKRKTTNKFKWKFKNQ